MEKGGGANIRNEAPSKQTPNCVVSTTLCFGTQGGVWLGCRNEAPTKKTKHTTKNTIFGKTFVTNKTAVIADANISVMRSCHVCGVPTHASWGFMFSKAEDSAVGVVSFASSTDFIVRYLYSLLRFHRYDGPVDLYHGT